MKKRTKLLLICTFVVILALSLLSCGNTENNTTNTDPGGNSGNGNTETVDVYDKLNALLAAADYPATVTTKTTEDGLTFNGRYAAVKEGESYIVEYSYEKLGLFTITDEGEIVAPQGFKTTYTGRIKVKDGKIIEKNGAEADISVETLDVKGITLSKTTLSDVTTNGGVFSAKIDSLKTVTGLDVTATAAAVEITYTEAKITKMVVSYSTSSYQSEITYLFG